MELDTEQQQAIHLCCDVTKRVVAVTGQAGSGKTTIIRLVHEHFTKAGYSVVLAAPTGKAAKRIQEATGVTAITVHRLLQYSHPGDPDPKTGKPMGISAPRRDRDNPIGYDVVIIDEYAMVNTEVHRNLFDAIKSGGLVRLFGDLNQLKPIEETVVLKEKPSPFQQMLEKMPSVRLLTNHRQIEGSGIIENALLINKGMMPRRRNDFNMIVTDSPVARLKQLIEERAAQGIHYNALDNQVLTPTNKGWIGTHALNGMMQLMYLDNDRLLLTLPRHEWLKKLGIICRVQAGSKVIYTSNNYGLEVFNGETGIVSEITDYGEIVLDLGDREVVVPPEQSYVNQYGKTVFFDPRKDIDLAYAITTHKSQGSEYGHITYVLNKSIAFMQGRKNTYTAVTRARKHVDFIADQRSLSVCVQPGKL